MLKSQIVQSVHAAIGDTLTKAQVQAVVDATLAEITKGLKADGHVHIAGFGIFKRKQREARMGPKPGSPGVKIPYPASTAVTFKPSKELKAAVASEEGRIGEGQGSS